VVNPRPLAVVALWFVAACTGGDGSDLVAPTTTSAAVVGTDPDTEPADPAPTVAPAVTGPATTSAVTAVTVTGAPTADVLGTVPEVGVPGLDSDDVFCAAWSRFGGTWQVLLVGSTFLGDPDRVAEWEVVASQLVTDAYLDLIDHLPPALAPEADVVADRYFGVLARRAESAHASFEAAGGTAAEAEQLGRAWVEALARRDPASPDLALDVPVDLRDLVSSAAAGFRSQRVEIHLDPSMSVSVATPLTDDFLATACPDEGTLTGQEIDPAASSG
jgi:hypothetical protein